MRVMPALPVPLPCSIPALYGEDLLGGEAKGLVTHGSIASWCNLLAQLVHLDLGSLLS